jgi:23S rRNA pseudouridine1911/1915/1917 synthase
MTLLTVNRMNPHGPVMSEHERPLDPGAYRYDVSDESDGLRLDQSLATAVERLSRGKARKLIELGGVHLDGRRVRRCDQTVSRGARVELFVDRRGLELPRLQPEHILFHDRDLIVLDKPAGMPTQPTPARYQGTLYAELQRLLRKLDRDTGRGRQRPGIGMVQRLDQDTSGVIVFSIHQRAHKRMTEIFRGRDVDKQYWALVAGRPAERGVFRSMLARRHATNLMVSVEKGGKEAETRYRTLRSSGGVSLVEVELVTGRTHQIRAHFAEAGLPLLGDSAYGGPSSLDGTPVPRQMLHSRQLAFAHPVSGAPLLFEASLPDDFSTTLRKLDGSLNGCSG